ncbi:MAG: hypothetical protein ACTSQI_14760 [Candidatus Helarchaeota archaeon]
MINKMQTAYVRVLRKIKTKSDGETETAKELVHDGVTKLVQTFPDAAGIIEASRKLYSTAVRTYKVPAAFIAESAKEGAQLLLDTFGTAACKEIFYILSSAIVHYINLNNESLAKSLAEDAATFLSEVGCDEQAAKIPQVLENPESRGDVKMF